MRYSPEELERLNVDSTAEVNADGVRPFIYHEEKSERCVEMVLIMVLIMTTMIIMIMNRNKNDEEELEGEWTLRKASAWALDCLANPYAPEVMEIMTPIILV